MDLKMKENIESLLSEFENSGPEDILGYFLEQEKYESRIALASSLGAEDQVLTDMIMKIYPRTRIFILDTGRLCNESYDVMSQTMNHYSMRFEICLPEPAEVEAMISAHGPNLFYDSIEMRKHCCMIRKIKPLRKKIQTLDVWITGLRRDQSITRTTVNKIGWDEEYGLLKLNPLANWTEKMIWDYIKKHNVPYNKLHDSGYPSIGCAPCTRAVQDGEDVRAGRWWWESSEHRECGLHSKKENL